MHEFTYKLSIFVQKRLHLDSNYAQIINGSVFFLCVSFLISVRDKQREECMQYRSIYPDKIKEFV